jgi:3-oxoadipate enol-lactonase
MSVEVHHQVEGPADAPVLVMSNSLGTTLEMWDGVVPALAEHCRILRYDQRGHGRSPVPLGPHSMADLGGDVVALLDRLGIERASFCGLSIGGMIAIWLGAHAPERIERLAICCTRAKLPPPEQWTERAATVRAQGMAPVVEAALERWFTPALHRDDEATVERFRRMLLGCDPEGYAGGCEALAGADLGSEATEIAAPALVIGGGDDPVAPPESIRELAEAIPGAAHAIIPDARHLVSVERPRAFTEALAEHLAAKERGLR